MDNSDFQKQVLRQERFRSSMSGLQTGMSVLQTAAAAHMSRQLADMRRQNADALALQQQMVEQEQFQANVEEFVYSVQKYLDQCDGPDCSDGTVDQYVRIQGILASVEEWGLGTPLIRGRENKAAFEKMLKHAEEALARLEKKEEVKQAIAHARALEQERLRLEREQEEKASNLELKKRNLRIRIDQLTQQRRSLSRDDWYAMNGFQNGQYQGADVPLDKTMFVGTSILWWAFGGVAWIPLAFLASGRKSEGFRKWYDETVAKKISDSCHRERLRTSYTENKKRLESEWNSDIDRQIAALRQELDQLN